MGKVFFGSLGDNLKSVAVIMAGGQGTRFWPASRRRYPKQFLPLGSGKESLIQKTVQRLEGLTSRAGIIIVAGQSQRSLVNEQLPEIAVLAEPVGRNTAPCIGYAAVKVLKTVGDVPMICLPADHHINGEEQLKELLSSAVEIAEREDLLVTVGIKPTSADTGYGYIQVEQGGDDVSTVRNILRFVEKPEQIDAERYVDSGDYYWNSGMFVWRPSVVLSAIEKCLPELSHQLKKIETFLGSESEEESIREVFSEIDPISIDFGVMEKVDNVVMIPGDTFQWSDVGSWGAWADCLSSQGEGDAEGNVVCGDSMILQSSNSVVVSNKRFVVGVGLDNIVVVETDDAVLVCHRDKVQDVKKVVEELSRCKRDDLI